MTGSIAADLSTGQGEAGAVFERWIKTGQWRRTGASIPTIVGGDRPRLKPYLLIKDLRRASSSDGKVHLRLFSIITYCESADTGSVLTELQQAGPSCVWPP